MIIAEAHLPTNGIVGAIGVVALVASGLLLFDTGSDFDVSAPVVIGAAIVAGGDCSRSRSRKVVEASRKPVLTGWEELIGAEGDVRVPLSPLGQVFVHGALWRATLADDVAEAEAERLRERGARVRVEAVEGLTLRVRPVAEAENTPAEGASS